MPAAARGRSTAQPPLCPGPPQPVGQLQPKSVKNYGEFVRTKNTRIYSSSRNSSKKRTKWLPFLVEFRPLDVN
jgi:hypothetical protein